MICKIDGKFYWALTKSCPLYKIINVEKEIEIIERIYLPHLEDELEDYHNHPWDKWFENVQVVREVNLK